MTGPITGQCDFSTPFFCPMHTLMRNDAGAASSPAGIHGPVLPGSVFQWFNTGHVPPQMMESGYMFKGYTQ